MVCSYPARPSIVRHIHIFVAPGDPEISAQRLDVDRNGLGAERARSRGDRAGALLFWLLREHCTAFITLNDEDRAAQRLREHLNGPSKRQADRERWGGDGGRSSPRPEPAPFTEQEQTVLACIRVATQHRLDPAHVARKAKGWSQEAWDGAYDAFQSAQFERQDRWRTIHKGRI